MNPNLIAVFQVELDRPTCNEQVYVYSHPIFEVTVQISKTDANDGNKDANFQWISVDVALDLWMGGQIMQYWCTNNLYLDRPKTPVNWMAPLHVSWRLANGKTLLDGFVLPCVVLNEVDNRTFSKISIWSVILRTMWSNLPSASSCSDDIIK